MRRLSLRLSPAAGTALFFALFSALLFRVVWPVDQTLQSGDYNYGLLAMYKSEMPGALFNGFWRASPLLGRVGHLPPSSNMLLLALLPLEVYTDWIYAINLSLSACLLAAFLRRRGLSPLPAGIGAFVALWLGSNLSLIYPGHLEKYGVMLWASAALYALERTRAERSLRWSMLAGGSMGWMFMHQADLALFFGLTLAGWWIFALWPNPGGGWNTRLRLTLPMLAVGALFVGEAYRYAMETQVRNVEVLESGSAEEKWNFATQWSWPPEESLDLIAPGYWGWHSAHETAPYHGRMGQSAEWKTNGIGFPNFKMESQYLGILPLALALLGLASAGNRKKECRFWGIVALLTFGLACGKYTPLYGSFFQLPLVNAIRNPNKFLQVFQWTLALPVACGAEALLRQPAGKRSSYLPAAGLLLISFAAAAASLHLRPLTPELPAFLRDSLWAGQAAGILANRQMALTHLSLFAAMAALCVAPWRPVWIQRLRLPALALLLATDALLLGRHYLQPVHIRFLRENPLADFLQENLGEARVAVIEPSGLYQFYLTHLFPARGIAFADIAVAPRLHPDYGDYFDAVGTDRLRLWREFGVKYVLLPRAQLDALRRQSPGIDRLLREVYAYDLAATADGGLRLLPGIPGRTGRELVAELSGGGQRFALIPRWQSDSREAFLDAVRRGEPPLRLARVQAEISGGDAGEVSGEIIGVLAHRRGFLLQVEVESDQAFLRLADRYSPALRASVNGAAAVPLLQTDLLFAGLILPRGLHEVQLDFELPAGGRWAQWAGVLLCIGIGLSLRLRIFRGNPPDSSLDFHVAGPQRDRDLSP